MKLYRFINYKDSLQCDEYNVERETKCFYWINDLGQDRRVSKNGKRRFAYPDKKEALYSFAKRKEKQISILGNQLKNAEETFAEAKEKLEKDFDTKFKKKIERTYDSWTDCWI